MVATSTGPRWTPTPQAQAAGQVVRRQGGRQLERGFDGGDRVGEGGHDPFAHGLDRAPPCVRRQP